MVREVCHERQPVRERTPEVSETTKRSEQRFSDYFQNRRIWVLTVIECNSIRFFNPASGSNGGHTTFTPSSDLMGDMTSWGTHHFYPLLLSRGHFKDGAFWGHTSFDDRFDKESSVSPILSHDDCCWGSTCYEAEIIQRTIEILPGF